MEAYQLFTETHTVFLDNQQMSVSAKELHALDFQASQKEKCPKSGIRISKSVQTDSQSGKSVQLIQSGANTVTKSLFPCPNSAPVWKFRSLPVPLRSWCRWIRRCVLTGDCAQFYTGADTQPLTSSDWLSPPSRVTQLPGRGDCKQACRQDLSRPEEEPQRSAASRKEEPPPRPRFPGV